jgi:uncharacterized membrane protein
MSLDPLLHASPIIQIHAAAAVSALLLGGWVLFRRKKGDAPHRAMGKVWVALMALVALSSFFIWEIRLVGLFSPIHLLSIFTLVMLYRGVTYARRHNIKAHMRTMQITYVAALIITGLFTFMPGRIMNKVVFGPAGADLTQSLGFFGFAAAVLVVAGLLVRRAVRIGAPERATP